MSRRILPFGGGLMPGHLFLPSLHQPLVGITVWKSRTLLMIIGSELRCWLRWRLLEAENIGKVAVFLCFNGHFPSDLFFACCLSPTTKAQSSQRPHKETTKKMDRNQLLKSSLCVLGGLYAFVVLMIFAKWNQRACKIYCRIGRLLVLLILIICQMSFAFCGQNATAADTITWFPACSLWSGYPSPSGQIAHHCALGHAPLQ